jgi:phenylpropionate dioxygenase-like ring-hydroxylating dioxygenase large terminal subunit
MVYKPTRGSAPLRLGETIVGLPGVAGSTLNADLYRDPKRFEAERTQVLRSSWMIAARSSELPSYGDWVVYEGHGETVIVCRQDDGSVAGFHNVCQHRGARLSRAEESGCDRRFTCPWHGWVYDTTGDLVGVPERDDFDPAHLDGLRSPKVAADEWGGWVWINMVGDDAPSLMDWIGADITTDLGQFAMDDMVLHDKLVYDLPVNYKAIVDGFNEVYHVTELHHVDPEFTKSARDAAFHLSGPNSMMFVPRHQHREALAETGDHHQFSICHYVVFPNAIFNNNPDQIQVFQPIPLTADTTRFICWELIYGPNGDDDTEYESYLAGAIERWAHLKEVVEEDLFVFGEVGAASQSMGYTQNIFSTRECKLTRYHEVMDHCVGGGSALDFYDDTETKPETKSETMKDSP